MPLYFARWAAEDHPGVGPDWASRWADPTTEPPVSSHTHVYNDILGTGNYAETIGDGTSTTILVTHGLGTPDILVSVYSLDTGLNVSHTITRVDYNTVQIVFSSAPAAASVRAIVVATSYGGTPSLLPSTAEHLLSVEPVGSILTAPRFNLDYVHSWDGMASGQLALTYVYPKRNITINRVDIPIGEAAAATPTLTRIGVYEVATNGNLTLISSTSNSTTMTTAAYANVTRTLTTTVTLAAGVTYAFGLLIVSTQLMPTMRGYIMEATAAAVAPRISGVIGSQTNLQNSYSANQVVPNSCILYMRGYKV